MIRIRRAYEPAARGDGRRLLVERLWPRGMRKEALRLDAWVKDVTPSTELRKWFSHRVDRWTEFQRRYRRELNTHRDAWSPILEASKRGTGDARIQRSRSRTQRRGGAARLPHEAGPQTCSAAQARYDCSKALTNEPHARAAGAEPSTLCQSLNGDSSISN